MIDGHRVEIRIFGLTARPLERHDAEALRDMLTLLLDYDSVRVAEVGEIRCQRVDPSPR